MLRLIPLANMRTNFPLRELANRSLDLLLFFGQFKLQCAPPVSVLAVKPRLSYLRCTVKKARRQQEAPAREDAPGRNESTVAAITTPLCYHHRADMRRLGFRVAALIAAGALVRLPMLRANPRGKKGSSIHLTQVTVVSGVPGCKVDVDGLAMGQTRASGQMVIRGVAAGDHYFHVDCPAQNEVTAFLSLKPGQWATIDVRALRASGTSSMTPLEAAKARIHLRHIVEQAIQFRSQGQFDEAVKLLREAAQLDPNNPDLHRELGITFLLSHDWAQARVEMLEALRHEPNSAGAHNDLGYALEKLGELEPALAQYRIAHRLDPTNDTYGEHYFDLLAQRPVQKPPRKRR
jgi:hypothetical protein